jgi:5'-3' exonuclease
MKQAHLLDISALFFRYYFAPGPYIENEEGWDVSALRSTVKWLCQKPFLTSDVTVAAFDESLGTGFRHEIDEDYKANRPLPSEDIVYQLTALKHICEHLGFNVFASDDLEADDLIASSAYSLGDYQCLIHSRDKDLRQLLSARVEMLDPVSKKRWTLENFREEMAIEPDQVPLYLALMGDSSDNIVGLPGIGDKTARRLLHDGKRLEALLEQAHAPELWDIRGAKGIAATLLEYSELIEHNLNLTVLVDDADLSFCDQKITVQQAEMFEALCQQFGIDQGMQKSMELVRGCVQ